MLAAFGVLAVLVLNASLGCGVRVVAAQETTLALGGPRFFFASSKSAQPVEVDASRTAVLRRRISLNLERPTVASLLAAIARQTGLEFLYSPEVVPVNREVGLHADSITVAAALTEILVDTGLDVLLSPGRQVVLVERRKLGPMIQHGTLVGRVTDAKTGQGLAGADVFLDREKWRTTTDTTGRYRLTEVDSGSYMLTVRRLGYEKQSRKVIVRAEQEDTVDVALTPAPVKLDELVATATGQQRRRDLGNAITTIHADSVLQSAPIRNLTDLLEDRVPGLTVQHTSGAPGDPARLRLRGISSVLRGNDPVVVVDGVRVYATQSDRRSGNLTNLGTPNITSGNTPAPSPLDQIDPNIIDKIEVFKGPSAATLYGADAANGVIVITTKKGRPGPVRWSASITHGRTDTPGRWPEGYYRFGHFRFYGGNTVFCPVLDLTCVQDSLVRFQALNDPNLTVLGQGRRTSLSLTASGGSQALTYSVTGTYGDETGLLQLPAFEVERFRTVFNREAPDWMRQPHHLQDWSVTSNVQAVLSRSADVTLSTTLSRSEQQRSTLENKVASLAGTYVDRVNNLYYVPGSNPNQNISDFALNQTANYLQDYYKRTTASAINFTTGLNANWRPRSWFTATGQAGLNVIPRDDELFLPAGLVTTTDSGALIRGTGRSLVSTFNIQGTVRRPLGREFVFETSVGANVTSTSTGDLVSSASGLVPGTSSLAGARVIDAIDSRVNTSVFGWYVEPRLSGQRLSLSTGLRLDGGSAYGARITQTGSGGGFLGSLLSLPKLNGSWVVSEEPWFPFKGLFSSLRLRGAYGQAQVQPGAADRLRLYSSRTDQSGQLLKLTTLGNTDLRPERSVEFEGGFDADLLDSRLTVELTGYRKTQVDALMSVSLPSSVNGGGSVIQNIGNIRNTGMEITVGLTPVRLPAVTWSAQLNYSRNTNTLVKLGRGVEPNPVQGIVAGYPVGGRWARPILGYADENGDGVLEPVEIQVGDSLVFMGRRLPAYTTSLFTNVVLFSGAVGITAGFSYESGATQLNQTARTNWVLVRALADPSTPFSEQASVLASAKAQDPTDYGLMQDVSTFRFNSLSVNYHAPASVARLIRAQQLTIAVQGANLGLHSTYQGKDPDVNAWSATENIIDTGQLPQPRTWQLSVFLQY